MFQHADADHEFYVSRQTDKGRSFASYRYAEAFLSEYEKIPPSARHFFEIIRGVCRFYVDVEFEELERRDDDARARLDLALVHCTETLNSVLVASGKPPINTSDWIVLIGSRGTTAKDGTPTWKHSYHASLRSVYFVDNHCALAALMAEVYRRFEDERLFCGSARKSIVDFSVYTKNRMWRLPLSSKLGGDPTPLTFEADGFSLVDAFVTVPPTDADVVLTEADVARVYPPPPAEKSTAHPSSPRQAPSPGIIRELTDVLRQFGDATSVVVRELPPKETSTRCFTCRTVGLRVCPHKHEHDSNNFFLVVKANGDVWYHCHKSTKSCSDNPVKIGCVGTVEDAASTATAPDPMILDDADEQGHDQAQHDGDRWRHEWWQHGDVAYKDVPQVDLVHVHKLATDAHRDDFYREFKHAITTTLAHTLQRLGLPVDKAPPWVTSPKGRAEYKGIINDMLVELFSIWCNTALGCVVDGKWVSTRIVLPVYFESKQMDGRAREPLMYESPLNLNLFVALRTDDVPTGITVEHAVTQFWNDLATVGAFGVVDGTRNGSHQFLWPTRNSVAARNDFVGQVVGHSTGSGALATARLNTCSGRTEGLTHAGKVERFTWALRRPKINGA